jgi:heptosyltransferase-2
LSRILVIRGGALGDFVLTLPAIRLLREGFPSAQLEVLGYKHLVALAEMSGYADAARSIEYAGLAGFFSDAGELSPELVEYFGGFQQIVSYLFDPDQVFSNNLKRAGVRNFLAGSPHLTGREHAARQLARPLESLALYLQDPAAVIVPNEKRTVNPMLLAIHPGSGSESKNWPLQRFQDLTSAFLAEKEERRILIVGGEADEARLAELTRALSTEKIEFACNLALPELAGRLQNCACYLGHDSGVSHLAAAVGVPSLLLFGPTDPAVWAPANKQVKVLRAPCLTMTGIGLADVLVSLGEIMS